MTEQANGFSDTPTWAADAIAWAAEREIVTGYPDETFRPDAPISRAAASRIVYRVAAT